MTQTKRRRTVRANHLWIVEMQAERGGRWGRWCPSLFVGLDKAQANFQLREARENHGFRCRIRKYVAQEVKR